MDDTDLNEDFIESMDDPAAFRCDIGGIHPAGRPAARRGGAPAAFLASEEAGFITGETYQIDGGRMAKLSRCSPLPARARPLEFALEFLVQRVHRRNFGLTRAI